MSHLNYDLYIYDNTGTQFTDTDGNGIINVDVSRLNTNENGNLYATVVLDFTSYGSGSGIADLDDYVNENAFAWDNPDSTLWSDSLTLVSGSYGSGGTPSDLGNVTGAPGDEDDWYEVASLTYDYVLPDNLDSQDSLYVDFNIYGLTESQVGSFALGQVDGYLMMQSPGGSGSYFGSYADANGSGTFYGSGTNGSGYYSEQAPGSWLLAYGSEGLRILLYCLQ